jgi:hypothetical protein
MGLGGKDIEGMRELPMIIHHFLEMAEDAPVLKRVALVRPRKPPVEN